MPVRIQRKRTKGWRMPEAAVYVGRPTFYGNPFKVAENRKREEAVNLYRAFMESSMEYWPNLRNKIRNELGGKDLACWCPLDQPCHADVLLEIANSEVRQ